MMSTLSKSVNRFSSIGLNEMRAVSLMDRVDTKFIFNRMKLNSILEQAALHYRILEIDGERISTYRNLYFDTKDLKFYNDHHNGKRNRIKIRIRKYVETNLCFIEVKQKNNKGRTYKRRRIVTDFEQVPSEETIKFVDTFFLEKSSIRPVLTNEFKRITLVSLSDSERITFDLNLSYIDQEDPIRYKNLIIAEIKQSTLNRGSRIFKILKSEAINPFRISKYCIGMAAMNPDLKSNAFKEKIRRINKITSP